MPIIVAPFFRRKCMKISVYAKRYSNDKQYIHYNSDATIKYRFIKFFSENEFY